MILGVVRMSCVKGGQAEVSVVEKEGLRIGGEGVFFLYIIVYFCPRAFL